ncbi:lipase family alpha/beta hydrolase [Ralstonia pseudosolanacearum]|uniref:lipase family alpha/beta hydrolase n=1 Tax=Ralstonia pseudosolanacearum TaxID=1310165 RepID=UPI003CFF0C80
MSSTNLGHNPEESGARLLHFIKQEITYPISLPVFENARPDHFESDHIAIFIHGFTANSAYLGTMMQEFVDHGIVALAFNYPSYDGIDRAAAELADALKALDKLAGGAISNARKVVLVCHSMGGLVGRAFISFNGGNQFVRKVVTLGTPHDATLTNSQLVRFFVTWGEYYTGLNSGGYSSSCRSALQLTMQDGENPFLQQLLDAKPVVPDVQFLSISGGKNMLKFGENFLRNKLINAFLQWKLGPGTNDGLVNESSSDFSNKKFRSCFPNCLPHFGNGKYVRYAETNHSFLISTQSVALEAISFAKV